MIPRTCTWTSASRPEPVLSVKQTPPAHLLADDLGSVEEVLMEAREVVTHSLGPRARRGRCEG